jgi:hypothetical protein
VSLYGEISDILIQRRAASGRNIVNYSTKTPHMQFYFKGVVYDLKEQDDGFCVKKWRNCKNGQRRQCGQSIVDGNFHKNLIGHMQENGIAHDLFIDGRLVYRNVDGDEFKEDAESESFAISIDDQENEKAESGVGLDTQSSVQMQKSERESDSKKDNVSEQQGKGRFGFLNFMSKLWISFIGVGLLGVAIDGLCD